MRVQYVLEELQLANIDLDNLGHAFGKIIVASIRAQQPVIDEPCLVFINDIWPIKDRILSVQGNCIEYYDQTTNLEADKRAMQTAWAGIRRATTIAMATTCFNGRAADINVDVDADTDADIAEADADADADVMDTDTDATSQNTSLKITSLENTSSQNTYSQNTHSQNTHSQNTFQEKRFPQFAKLPGELQIMIWEAAVQPPPCGHIFHITYPPKTNAQVATALQFFPDAGLWVVCHDSRNAMKHAYNKKAAYFRQRDAYGKFNLCRGNLRSPFSTWAEQRAEEVFLRFAKLPWHVGQVRSLLDHIHASMEVLLWHVIVAVPRLRKVLLPVVPADAFATTFGPVLQPGWIPRHHVPLWRIQRARVACLSDEEATHSHEALHDEEETHEEDTHNEETCNDVEMEDDEEIYDDDEIDNHEVTVVTDSMAKLGIWESGSMHC